MTPRSRNVDEPTNPAEPGDQILYLAPTSLEISPFHRRTRWGDMKLLSRSVAETGVVMPLIVRWVTEVGAGDEPHHEIVVGHRRHKASITAKLETVPCILRDLTDDEVIEVQATENMGREDLHPLDEADYYELLIERGWDRRQLAKRFAPANIGAQPGLRYIRDRLLLLKLTPTARKAYATDKITHRTALLAAAISVPDQQNALVAAAAEGHFTDDDSAAIWVRQNVMVGLDDVAWALDDRAMPGGACTECPKRTGSQGDLFAAVTEDDRCLDLSCWRGKMDRAAQLITEVQPDVVRLDERPDRIFLAMAGGRATVVKASGYVDAEADCPHLPGRRWIDAVIAAGVSPAPTLHLAQDASRRPRLLYQASAVDAAVRKAVRDQRPAIREVEADPARKLVAAAGAERRALEDQILVKLRDLTDTARAADSILPLVGQHLIAAGSIKRVAKVFGVEPNLDALIAGADDRDPLIVLVALVVAEVGLGDPIHTEIRALADQLDVALPQE